MLLEKCRMVLQTETVVAFMSFVKCGKKEKVSKKRFWEGFLYEIFSRKACSPLFSSPFLGLLLFHPAPPLWSSSCRFGKCLSLFLRKWRWRMGFIQGTSYIFFTFFFREMPLFMIIGVFCMFLGQFTYLLGVYYVSPDVASMLQPVVPVWTFIVAVIAKVEKLPNVRRWNGALKMFGVLFAVGGALMTTFGKQQQHKTNEVKDDNKSEVFHVLGYLCIIYNTLSMALLAVLQKKYIFENTSSRWKSSPVNVIAWSYFFGFLSMALASLYYYNQPEKFSSINNSAIYVLIYAVFITSALCYMLITWVNTKISASLVTAFWPLQVLFCVVLAYFVTGETLNALEICGGILVIFSLLAVIWSNFQEEKEKAFSVNKDFHDEKPLIHWVWQSNDESLSQ